MRIPSDLEKGILSGNRKLFNHQNDLKISDWMPLCYSKLKNGCHAYFFTNALNLNEMLNEAIKVGFKLHNILVWEKNNCTPSQYYMKNCEYILFMHMVKPRDYTGGTRQYIILTILLETSNTQQKAG